MKKTVETKIDITASSEKVWGILADTNSYYQWNPFIKSVSGVLKEGEEINVVLNPPGGSEFTFSPLVLKANHPEIRWIGKFLFKGLFDGEHYFRLETISAHQTRVIHGEKFSGLFIPFTNSILKKTEEGFIMMNEALKKKAEQ
jgi:hypothetical protein